MFHEVPGPERERHGLRANGATALHERALDLAPRIPPWATPIFHLYQGSDTEIKVVVGNVTKPTEGFGGWYSTITFYCDISPEDRPSHVAISWPANRTQSAKIPVFYPDPITKRAMTVCYSVLYRGYNGVSSLRQNFEYVRLMGAEHVFFYVMSVGQDTEDLFRYYTDIGFLTVLKMPKNFITNHYWYYGQSLANYDCHSRNKYTTDLVALHDHDEYIFPLQHSTWAEMIRSIDDSLENKADDKQIAAYTFQHKFLCKNVTLTDSPHWAELKDKLKLTPEEEVFIDEHKVSVFQRVTSRGASNFWDFPRRSKSIIRPRLVKEVFTHMPRVIVDSARRCDVDNQLAFLAHYWKLQDFTCVYYDLKVVGFLRTFLDGLMKASSKFEAFVKSGSKAVIET